MACGFDDKDLLGIWQEATGEGEYGLQKVMEAAVQRVLEKELMAYLLAESHERMEVSKERIPERVQAEDTSNSTDDGGA